MRVSACTTLVLILSALSATAAVAPPAGFSEKEAVDQLRDLMLMRSYGEGEAVGRRLIADYPEDRALTAWWLIHLARNGRSQEAVRRAEALRTDNPGDPWAAFALAGTLAQAGERAEEARSLSEQFLAAVPDSSDAAWLRANVLQQTRRHRDAIEFIDAWRRAAGESAELLAVRGNAYYSLSTREKDQALFEKALASWEEALKLDPGNIGALYLSGYYLGLKKRHEEALENLSRAAELAPCSNTVHSRLWYVIARKGGPDKTAAGPQLEAFLKRCGEFPEAPYTVYSRARLLELPELEQRAAEIVLKEQPDGPGAEWVLVNRYRALAQQIREEKSPADSEPVANYRKMLRDFLDRPNPVRTSLLGDAWRSLYYSLLDDERPDPEQLLESVEGMVRWEDLNPHTVYGRAPVALAEHTPYLERALEIARSGFEVIRARTESRRQVYKTEQDFEEALKTGEAGLRDAIGWIHFQAGDYDKAERELLKASELSPVSSADHLYHLGRLYEATARLDRAEEYYIRGLSRQTPGTNPNEAAVRTLFEKRHGGMDGFEEYWEGLEEIDRRNRKRDVLAARIDEPQPVPAFALPTAAGKELTLDSLTGRVVVINYWGIWCGWCVKEMPEFQLLHERYRNDPAVAILTINNDQDFSKVPPWMQEKGYDFEVLIDDGYVSDKAAIRAFPTTWFLDANGRKAFEKVGWTEKLLEEFSWRIEALRGAAGSVSKDQQQGSAP